MSFKIKNRPSVFKIKNRPLARLVGMLIRQKQHTHNAPGPPSQSLTSECILLRTVCALSMSRLTPFFFSFYIRALKMFEIMMTSLSLSKERRDRIRA